MIITMKKKLLGLAILLIVYGTAVVIGWFTFLLITKYMPFILAVLIADVAATIFVWAMGVLCRTPSVYDPYWSLQTFFIYLGSLVFYNNWNQFTLVPLVVILIYSIRLTANFIKGFHNLTYVDWRYSMLKEKSGKLFQLVNLFGICMFPTLVVYSASIPLMVYASLPFESFSYVDFIGSGVILLGTTLELISDLQMKQFIKNRQSNQEVINVGLWKYSRHPNYLGEILVWFGVALVLIPMHFQYWYFIFGAIINLLMFAFISIPMEEKHMLSYKPNLREYIKTTSPILILPRKRSEK